MMVEIESQPCSLPNKYIKVIEKELESLGLSLSDEKQILDSILFLSDFYINNPSKPTPWDLKQTKIAYLSYYFTLNYLRTAHIYKHISFFLADINSVLDFGSGLGSASLVLEDESNIKSFFVQELSNYAINIHQNLSGLDIKKYQGKSSNIDLLVCSYSLTEVEKLSESFFNIPNLLLIEPSTKEDSKKLINLRQNLMDKGYTVLAPCTHQGMCPLQKGKSDWCHFHFNPVYPDYLLPVLESLPMNYNSISYSYLLLSKTESPRTTEKARLIGLTQKEKGKTKHMICRSPDREFVSKLDRDNIQIDLSSGDLIDLKGSEKKGNELRLKKL